MVQEGSWAYIDIGDSTLFKEPLPTDVVASVFANLETYLVLANYSKTEVIIETTQNYRPSDEPTSSPRRDWKLKGRSFVILRQEKNLA